MAGFSGTGLGFFLGGPADLDRAAVVALGGDLSWGALSPVQILDAALDQFPGAGLPVLARSSVWRSAAWPDPHQPDYRNAVVLVEPTMSPKAMLEALMGIEKAFGRVRSDRYAPRTLDLDLIAHGRLVQADPELTLPHPRAAERFFVMGPLAEIAPHWRHPVLGRAAEALAERAPVGRDARPEGVAL
jgi:2-amino-4-hydroxy-6-hydroxymethyldihydropteridine diphosphokinase